MSMTVQELVSEARRLPRAQKAELLDALLDETFSAPDADIEAAWKIETRRRVTEIENGAADGVPGEQVMAELRGIAGR